MGSPGSFAERVRKPTGIEGFHVHQMRHTLACALGYPKFRNDVLHADWAGITASGIEGCLAFVQGLLIEHFS